jgi:hypothetical protein
VSGHHKWSEIKHKREKINLADFLVCPVHGIRDCSPLLNGCNIVIRQAALVEAVEAAREHLRHTKPFCFDPGDKEEPCPSYRSLHRSISRFDFGEPRP